MALWIRIKCFYQCYTSVYMLSWHLPYSIYIIACVNFQAYKANVICPNKHQADMEKFHNNRLLESETYIGGHVECLESGVFRSDLPTKFRLEPCGYEVCMSHYTHGEIIDSKIFKFFISVYLFYISNFRCASCPFHYVWCTSLTFYMWYWPFMRHVEFFLSI